MNNDLSEKREKVFKKRKVLLNFIIDDLIPIQS
jgi:hypothetical protein